MTRARSKKRKNWQKLSKTCNTSSLFHKNLKHIILSLAKADSLKVESLAFPALGGGVFGFPRDLAADLTVHGCVRYFKENSSSTIKLIKFMNFDLPTVKNPPYIN